MNLAINEAIQLILDFHYILIGYWKDIPIEDPLVCQFIKEGYASLDAEYQEKYVLNDKGTDCLHTYIECISTAFIEFLKKNRLSCFDTDAIQWFSKTYGLDRETAESLYDYISLNLKVYGYQRNKFHQSKHGWGYQFDEILSDNQQK